MLEVEIIKMHESGWSCANPTCPRDPEYVNTILTTHHIKTGTICAMIRIGKRWDTKTVFYCRSCIDDVYKMIKSKLDTKLWSFQ